MKGKVRIDYIDYAKGLGILLMVIGHYEYLNHSFTQWIYSFHMPMFFLISGYLDYKFNLYTEVTIYVKKKVRSLLVPYYFFAFLILVLEFIIGKNRDIVHGLIYSLYYIQDPGFWFFFLLFVTDLFFLLYRKIIKLQFKIITIILLFFCSLLVGWGEQTYRDIPFKADFYPSCAFYFVIGALVAEYWPFFDEYIKNRKCECAIILLVLSIFVLCYVGIINDIHIWVFIARPHYPLITLIGIFFVIMLGVIIDCTKMRLLKIVLKYLAVNAIVICIFHSKVFWLVRTIDAQVGIAPSSWQSHFIVIAVEICLLVPTVYMFNRYIPFLVGKRK